MNYYLEALQKYAVFKGRASRKEYWYFVLFNFIASIVLVLITKDNSFVVGLYRLAIIIPTIAVGVRRMHDTNKSGWFVIVPIYNFILAVRPGTKGENKYGPESLS